LGEGGERTKNSLTQLLKDPIFPFLEKETETGNSELKEGAFLLARGGSKAYYDRDTNDNLEEAKNHRLLNTSNGN